MPCPEEYTAEKKIFRGISGYGLSSKYELVNMYGSYYSESFLEYFTVYHAQASCN